MESKMYRIVNVTNGKHKMVPEIIYNDSNLLEAYGYMRQDLPIENELTSEQLSEVKDLITPEPVAPASLGPAIEQPEAVVEAPEEVKDTFNESIKEEPKAPKTPKVKPSQK